MFPWFKPSVIAPLSWLVLSNRRDCIFNADGRMKPVPDDFHTLPFRCVAVGRSHFLAPSKGQTCGQHGFGMLWEARVHCVDVVEVFCVNRQRALACACARARSCAQARVRARARARVHAATMRIPRDCAPLPHGRWSAAAALRNHTAKRWKTPGRRRSARGFLGRRHSMERSW